jgi:outer membrane protein assembly factor BamD
MLRPGFSINSGLYIFALISLFLLSGCTSTNKKKNLSPGELITLGKQQVKLKSYDKAEDFFQQLLEDYPDSKERVQGLIFLANTHYLDEEYEEAKFHYQKFIELYPANRFADRAYYFKAMSDFKLREIATRDQTNTLAALEGFEETMKRFPNSTFYQRAVQKKKECLEILATSEFEVGKFYYRTGHYQSAILRLKNLREIYPNQGFADEAIYLIAESYLEEENYSEAKLNYIELLKKYPKSEFSLEARVRLRALRQ